VTERIVAAFDFDGTVTRRDTVVPFLAFACGRARVASALAAVSPQLALSMAGRGSRDDSKEALLRRLLAGHDAEPIDAAGRTFGERLANDAKRLRADTLEKVRWHRDEGHELVLVSASLSTYLEPIAPHLGFDAVLATTLEVGPDGRFTGGLVGRNCRGVEKADRLRAWLGDRDGDECVIWAYGDSSGDTELLAMAHRPHRVRRAGRR
jgi:HAD superfamily hydrolase (TIGR01490 family)